VDVVIYRELTLKLLVSILVRSAQLTGVVMLLIAASTIFSWYLTIEEVPQHLASFVIDNHVSKPVLIFLIVVLFLFLGSLIDGLAAMIMVVPILLPIFESAGLNPLHMGVVIVAVSGLGVYH